MIIYRTAASGTTALQKQIFNTYNPFRYRGYYYDVETQLYYLQSRYYDPATGRFLNADGYINANGDLLGYNMYAYCSNNPVMNTDPTGEAILTTLLIGVAVGLASQLISDCVTSAINEEWHMSSPAAYIGSAVGGAVSALIPTPFLSGALGSAMGTLTEMSLTNCYNAFTGQGEVYSFEETFYTVFTNATLGLLCDSFGASEAMFDDVAVELAEKTSKQRIIYGIGSSMPGDFFAGALNSEFGETMPTSHRWDMKPVRIY